MPKLEEALDQIQAIHAQVARSRVYRGYRAVPTAMTGVLAVAAALAQPAIAPNAVSFVTLWTVCAAMSAGVVISSMIAHPSARALEAVRRVVWPLFAGAVITIPLYRQAPEMLPGAWQMFFALAILSSLPVLPRGMVWVGLFYLASGAVVMGSWAPASMGVPFAIGQGTAAYVLYRHQSTLRHG